MNGTDAHSNLLHAVLDGLVVPAMLLDEAGIAELCNPAAEGWIFDAGIPLQRVGLNYQLDLQRLPADAVRSELCLAGRRYWLVQRPTSALRADPISGLPNASVAFTTLSKALQAVRALGNRLSVMQINCDLVRRLGASQGRLQAAALERALSERIRRLSRRGELACSLGPGAYLVLSLSCEQIEDAWSQAMHWVDALSQPIELEGRELTCAVSAGVAVAPEHGDEPGLLIDHASSAAQLASTAGRGEVRVYSAAIAASMAEDLNLENALAQAIDRAELSLVFQPKVVPKDDTVHLVGAEALVRWTHPQWGPVSPGKFIPVAERSGLMAQLGDWITDATCAQVAEWQRQGLLPVPIAINVSSQQLLQTDFRWRVESCLTRHRLNSEQITLEITESALLQDAGESIRLLRALGDMGLSIAIDDFGTGYSSLAYLRRFPADLLKIDKTFVDGIEDDPQAAGILQAIVAMARTLNMEVIVEGVESDAQFRRLAALGCRQFQGYYFGRPEAAEQFAPRWLQRAVMLPLRAY